MSTSSQVRNEATALSSYAPAWPQGFLGWVLVTWRLKEPQRLLPASGSPALLWHPGHGRLVSGLTPLSEFRPRAPHFPIAAPLQGLVVP